MRLRQQMFVCLLFVSLSAQSPGQEKNASSENKGSNAAAAALKKFTVAANEYSIFAASDKSKTFQLNSKPILNWNNPARFGENGGIYVWMKQGRPEVIGSIFTYNFNGEVRDKHEFHSLATEPIVARIEDESVWTPAKPGVEFKPIPRAPAPAKTLTRRKFQLRQLSRRFSGTLIDRNSGQVNLRLVPAPLIVYTPQNHNCKVGAIFSLAYGTDPEILLLLECRENGAGKLTWQYAFARYHYFAVKGQLDNKEVYSVEMELSHARKVRSTTDLRDRTYISFAPE